MGGGFCCPARRKNADNTLCIDANLRILWASSSICTHFPLRIALHSIRLGCFEKNGTQSIGRTRGGWNTKLHMVAASDRDGVIPLNLIALFVQFLIVVPRIFTIAFGRNNGHRTGISPVAAIGDHSNPSKCDKFRLQLY